MTKKEMFAEIIKLAEGAETTATMDEITEFARKEIDALSRKASASRKPTKTQIENEALKGRILEHMTAEDKPLTVKEIWGSVPELADLSNQRVTHLVLALLKEGKVQKTQEKKINYYSILA